MVKTSKDEEERILGDLVGRAPDAVVPTRMVSIEWRCDTCGEMFRTAAPGPCPAPCARCGGVCFTTFADWQGQSPR